MLKRLVLGGQFKKGVFYIVGERWGNWGVNLKKIEIDLYIYIFLPNIVSLTQLLKKAQM